MTRRQPRVRERARLRGEQRAVRRQRHVEPVVDRREPRDQMLEVPAQQRLAARDAQLADALLDERPRDPLDLLEREQLLAVHEPVAAAEDLLRHAVDAAEVAAVGDGDAQVAERPAERVRRAHGVESTAPGEPGLSGDSPRTRLAGAVGSRGARRRRARRRHRRLGAHLRPGQGRGRALPALRLPRRPLRDRERHPGAAGAASRTCAAAARLGRRRRARTAARRRLRAPDRRARADDGLEHGLHHGLYVVFTPLLARILFGTRIGAARPWRASALSHGRAGAPLGRRRGDGHRRRARPRRARPPTRCRSCSWSGTRRGTTRSRSRSCEMLAAFAGFALVAVAARPGRGAARLDGVGRAARHGRVRERARRSSSRPGRSGARARRGRRSRSRWSRSSRPRSGSGSRATGSARPAGPAPR